MSVDDHADVGLTFGASQPIKTFGKKSHNLTGGIEFETGGINTVSPTEE